MKKSKRCTNYKAPTWCLQIDGKLPCPVCKQWGAATNFKRDHIGKHGLPFANAPEYLNHRDYKPIVEQMYQERMENKSK
jgi:hypothetical protein